MKKNADNILIVEGSNDKAFFEKICEKHGLSYSIKVSNPSDYPSANKDKKSFNSKQGVINILDTLLPLLEYEEPTINKIAIVIDCDVTGSNNGGFQKTIDEIQEKAYSYSYLKYSHSNPGIEIKHKDKNMNSIGVWVMPDNKSDGTIESWVKNMISQSEIDLFNHACNAVQNLPITKFSDSSIIKAELATWLAWQNQPGRTLAYTLKNGKELIDVNNRTYLDFIDWLKRFCT